MTNRTEEPLHQWTWRDYLTPGSLIPLFLLASVFLSVLFFYIVPEIRDYTAFWGASHGTVDRDPIQTQTDKEPFLFQGTHGLFTKKNIYRLTPTSSYDIEARVLHTRRYHTDENSADLIPFDMGLGWRMMSDAEKLNDYFVFHHRNTGGRVLWIVPKGDWRKIPPTYLEEMQAGLFFSNNHLIPATDEIFDALAAMKTGDRVRLQGYLVDVTRPRDPAYRWITGKHPRSDAQKNNRWGDGASYDNLTTCDTIFVTKAEILRD